MAPQGLAIKQAVAQQLPPRHAFESQSPSRVQGAPGPPSKLPPLELPPEPELPLVDPGLLLPAELAPPLVAPELLLPPLAPELPVPALVPAELAPLLLPPAVAVDPTTHAPASQTRGSRQSAFEAQLSAPGLGVPRLQPAASPRAAASATWAPDLMTA